MSQNGPVIRRSSPQIAQVSSISSTMLDVIVALLPALGMAVYLFGPWQPAWGRSTATAG